MAEASRKLLGNGSIYTLATAAPMLTGILITPLLTRALGIIEYDQVSLAIVVMNFTVGLLALGLPMAIIRHSVTEKTGEPGARGVAISGALISLAIGVVAAAVLFFAGLPLAVALGVLAGAAGGGVAMTQAYSLAREDSWFYVALAFGVSLLAPAAAMVAVFLFERTAATYYMALAAVYVLVCAAGFARMLSQGPATFGGGGFARALRIGLPIIPHQIAVGSATGVAVVVAQLQLQEGASAQTQLALLVASAPLIIISALSYAWTPIILRAPEAEQGPQLEETARNVAWLAALGGGALALLSPWFLEFLAPAQEYGTAEMVPVVAVASLAACLAAAYLAHLQLVVARGATGPLAIFSPLALIAGGVAAYVLAPWLGLLAMGFGFALTFLLFLVFTRVVARRASPVRWRERVVFVPILAGVVFCAIGALLPWDGWAGVAGRLGAAALLLAFAAFRFLRGMRKPAAVADVVLEAPIDG